MKKKSFVYVTKCVSKNFTSCRDGSFTYPRRGYVEAADWNDKEECGGGLHGFLWGEGNGELAQFDDNTYTWLLIRVDPAEGLIVFKDKCKFRRGYVLQSGGAKEIATAIGKYLPTDRIYNVIYGTATAGDWGTATAGDWGTATAGDRGTATAGDWGTATAGNRGTATAGDWGTATAGDRGTATAGYCGTATAGYCGTATAGYCGTATAGDSGTATAGNRGTATAGNRGTATAGNRGTATAGDRGAATAGDCGNILIRYWANEACIFRVKCGVIGENGLRPGVLYRLDDSQNFVEVEEKP